MYLKHTFLFLGYRAETPTYFNLIWISNGAENNSFSCNNKLRALESRFTRIEYLRKTWITLRLTRGAYDINILLKMSVSKYKFLENRNILSNALSN